MNAFVSCEGTSPLALRVNPFPSPPPRSHPATFTAPDLLAIDRPQPSPYAARDSKPSSPLASSPNDFRADTSIHAPASAAMRHRGRVSLRADLGHASYASSPASVVRRSPSPFRSHPTAEGTGGAPRVLPLRGNFSMRGEMMHVFVSYRVATEGKGRNGNGNGLSGLLAQKIRSLSMHEKGLQLPRHGWYAPALSLHELLRCALFALLTRHARLSPKCFERNAP